MNKKIYISATLLYAIVANAQVDKDKTIGTEEVSVISSYKPTVQDAFKINDNPLVDDQEVSEKKKISYNIFSFPVASTFQPEKGKAAEVDQDSIPNYLNNYALIGYGNYNTLRAELGVVEKVGKNSYIGGIITHRSSGGGIDNVPVDNGYSNSKVRLMYANKTEFRDWNISLGTNASKYHWYGFPTENIDLSYLNYKGLDVVQKYQDVNIGTQIQMYRGALETIDAKYTYFWDAFSSKESRFYFRPKFNLELPNQTVYLNLIADYVNTQFSDNTVNNQNHQYNYFIWGVEPSIRFYKNNYNIELGAGVGFVNGDNQAEKDNAILIYPKIKANVDLVPDIVQAYVGADGGIIQNSYQQLSEQNPFVAPTLRLMPTQKKYDVYGGVKGKLYHNISYNIKASYKTEDQKALYTLYTYQPYKSERLGYEYGNSFVIDYDLVNTLTGVGELTFDLKNIDINVYGEYNSYKMDRLSMAYNLPEAQMGVKLHADITPKIFAGMHLYYVSSKQDEQRISNATNTLIENYLVKMDSFADLNINVGYKPNKHWTMFLKGNNLFNQNYQNFANYRVQGAQVLGGVMYKFDFGKE